jgi:septation ring formation regulator EzrA
MSKALYITPWFAGILASIGVAFIVGGLGYAWNMNADLAVIQRDLKRINESNLDNRMSLSEVRLSVIESSVKNVVDSVGRVESKQDRMGDKLDKLLERK